MKVFIDVWRSKSRSSRFSLSLAERLQKINTLEVTHSIRLLGDDADNKVETEKLRLKAIESSDIVIPVITSGYVAKNSHPLNHLFDKIIESNDKYVFPILYEDCNWSNVNWIVKSKVFPEDNQPYLGRTDEGKIKVLISLETTIQEIIENPIRRVALLKDLAENSTNLVFVSHDHNDADFAELLKLKLEKNGIIAWLDSEKLKIGQDWRQEIDEGIVNSSAIIVVMTPEARKSEYVTYEWAFAFGKGKPIFPLMLRQTQLHPRLESLQYLDFTNKNTRPYDQLFTSIKNLKN